MGCEPIHVKQKQAVLILIKRAKRRYVYTRPKTLSPPPPTPPVWKQSIVLKNSKKFGTKFK